MSTVLYVPVRDSDGFRSLPHLYATGATLWIFGQSKPHEWHTEIISAEDDERELAATPSALDIGKKL